MRIYLPATATDLGDDNGLSARWAHAVTASLRSVLPDEDDEGLEMTATLAAADDAVRRIAADGSIPRRVVVAADVSESLVDAQPEDGEDRLPTAIRLHDPVPWTDVVALLVDEADAEPDVRDAAAGDDSALERSAERDLLWYDVLERADLLRELEADV